MKYLKLFILTALLAASSSFSQVNINTATAEELSALAGIGPKKAEAIILYRKAKGKFSNVSELANVKGIGEKTVKQLGSDIKISGKTDLSKLKNKPKRKVTKTATKAKAETKDKTSVKKKKTAKKPTDKK
ncbi:MAG: hypothetical protein CSA45_00375 [Gammaproteobacteria bacterium]|nr:MAG: hypothetical protein CSA45_00375 [Gammaproteobacteria bacterium]